MSRRIERINSLLKEVISDVIRKEVKNPNLPSLITVTHVEVTKDLKFAKVHISVVQGDTAQILKILNNAAGFIAIAASKQVELRYFPELTFHLDNSVEMQMRIESALSKIHEEEKRRE